MLNELSNLRLLQVGGGTYLEGIRRQNGVDELLKGDVVGLNVGNVVNQVLECKVSDRELRDHVIHVGWGIIAGW
jgi:hypothetical protein